MPFLIALVFTVVSTVLVFNRPSNVRCARHGIVQCVFCRSTI